MAKKTAASILEDAATVIETRGKCSETMYNPTVDKFCAIGAIARATYPKRVVPDGQIEAVAWMRLDSLSIYTKDQQAKYDPRFAEALRFAAEEARARYKTYWTDRDDHAAVYEYNDRRGVSKNHVASMLRAAAKRARKAEAKAKAKA